MGVVVPTIGTHGKDCCFQAMSWRTLYSHNHNSSSTQTRSTPSAQAHLRPHRCHDRDPGTPTQARQLWCPTHPVASGCPPGLLRSGGTFANPLGAGSCPARDSRETVCNGHSCDQGHQQSHSWAPTVNACQHPSSSHAMGLTQHGSMAAQAWHLGLSPLRATLGQTHTASNRRYDQHTHAGTRIQLMATLCEGTSRQAWASATSHQPGVAGPTAQQRYLLCTRVSERVQRRQAKGGASLQPCSGKGRQQHCGGSGPCISQADQPRVKQRGETPKCKPLDGYHRQLRLCCGCRLWQGEAACNQQACRPVQQTGVRLSTCQANKCGTGGS